MAKITAKKASLRRCTLCEREVSRVTRHHLVPKAEGGRHRDTTDLCSGCHHTLHNFFTNRTLSKELSTIEALRQEPEIARYLAWVRKQPDSRIRVRTHRSKR
jgi:5-methylcytosine-specific restriction protein A